MTLAVGGAIAVAVGAPLVEWAKRSAAQATDDKGPDASTGAQIQIADTKNSIIAGAIIASPTINAKKLKNVTVNNTHATPAEHKGQPMPNGQQNLGGPAPPLTAPYVRHNLPPRNPKFTGREKILDNLQGTLPRGAVAVIAVRGLGGIGKTQLALEYAHRIAAQDGRVLVWWVRAEAHVTLVEDLAALAKNLGFDDETPPGELASQALAALEVRSNWLLLFDNADDPTTLHEFIPRGGGQLVITSRHRGWGGLAEQIELDSFERDESVKYIARRSDRDEPILADELAAELGDLPLALAQAAAYIDKHDMTVGAYFKLYRDHVSAKILRNAGLDPTEYPASIAATWLLHFKDLRRDHPAALELLRVSSFLDPDSIDLELLLTPRAALLPITLSKIWVDPLARTNLLGTLAETSLISRLDDRRIKIHRLVQAVTRDQLTTKQSIHWGGLALRLLDDAFATEINDYKSWSVHFALAPHAKNASEHASQYNQHYDLAARVLGRLGTVFREAAQFDQSLKAFQRALSFNEASHGPESRQAVPSLVGLGNAYYGLDDYERALETYQRALSIATPVYGSDSPQVAGILVNLGNVYHSNGNGAEALRVLQRALAINETVHGPADIRTAKALGNLGRIQLAYGRQRDALKSFRDALAIFESIAPNGAESGQALVNIGNVHTSRRHFGEALRAYDAARVIFENAYGPNHPETAKAFNNLGHSYFSLGHREQAVEAQLRVIQIFEHCYGNDDPRTLEYRARLDARARTKTLSRIFGRFKLRS